jgi:hypothetical protein
MGTAVTDDCALKIHRVLRAGQEWIGLEIGRIARELFTSKPDACVKFTPSHHECIVVLGDFTATEIKEVIGGKRALDVSPITTEEYRKMFHTPTD